MSLKKMLMLASMALAVVAFAAPTAASGSQLTWTAEHEHLETGEEAESAYEGKLEFTRPEGGGVPHSTFGCQVTVKIRGEGPTGGTVTAFNPTTTECTGTGIFAGCQLQEDTSNIAEGWEVSVTGTDLEVVHRDPQKDLTIHNKYHSCTLGAIPDTHLEFKKITVEPLLDGAGTIKHLTISGVSTTGVTASGSVTPELGAILGLTS